MRLRDFSPSPLHKTSALSSQLTLPWRPPLSQWVGVGNPKPDGCGLGGGRARATPKESSRTASVAARTARARPCARTKARPGGISYPEPRGNMTGLVPWTARGESVFWGRGGEQGKRRTTAVSENTATDAAQVDTPKSVGSGLLFSSVSRTHARPASPSVPPPGLILPTHTHPMVVDSRRAELDADAALDAALDVGLRRLVYGTLAGLAAGAVLFRECWLGGWEGRWSAVERGAAMRAIPPFLSFSTHTTGGPCTRGAAVALGAGFGLGSAYADSRRELRVAFPPAPSARAAVPPPPPAGVKPDA